MDSCIFRFPSGLRMVYRYIPSVRSVGVAVFTATGSENEVPEINGISHFIEHMMFKGTKTRNAFQIVDDIDCLGAQINAFTSKTHTCFYTLSLSEVVPKCVDILSDILFNHTFDPEEMEREKGVVCEEIAMSEDDNDDVVFDLSSEAYFANNSLGMTILGPKENIKNFRREQLIDYVDSNYVAETTVISITGYIDFEVAKKLVLDNFEGRFKSNPNRSWKDLEVKTTPQYLYKFKDIEQSNITLIMPGCLYESQDIFANLLINNMIGGGMSSRLFQNIREKNGLAYNVYSYPTSFMNNGTTEIYLGTNLKSVKKSIICVKDTIQEIINNGFTQKELDKGIMQLKSTYIMGQESNASLMRAYGKAALFVDELFDIDSRIKAIENVTLEKAHETLIKYFDFSKASIAYVGPKIEGNLLELIK